MAQRGTIDVSIADSVEQLSTARTADRPHSWTIILTFGAMIVSLAAVVVSVLQYRNAAAVRDDTRRASAAQKKSLELEVQALRDTLS
jgi:hypothetical protein